jgi:hypothetical protein
MCTIVDMKKNISQVKDLRQLGDSTKIVILILDLKSPPN